MSSSPGLSADALTHAALGAGALFQGVVGGDPAALAFYAHDWRDLAAAAEQAAARPVDRDALADALLAQNERWGATDAVRDHIAALRDPSSVAVLTGQQLGLFGGPLYTVWKALGAVRLARRLAREAGRPAVPVFWLAGEDHDFDEVHRTVVPSGEAARTVAYNDGAAPQANRGAVGRLVLDADAIGGALAELRAALPDGPHRDGVLALAETAWAPGRRWRDAFADTLRALTRGTGLVLASPDDPELKRLAAPLLSAELADPQATAGALAGTTERVREAGYGTLIEPGAGQLFWMADGARLALSPDRDGGWSSRDGAVRLSPDGAAEVARATPERLSPNVVLRPVLQDALFPTVAYVAGPGETAYFAQLGGVYRRFGVAMPAVVPRLSVTLVGPGVAKVLDRYGLGVPELRPGVDRLWARLTLDAADVDLPAAFADARAAALSALAPVAPLATDLDASLDAAVGAARARIERAVDRLEAKTLRVQRRRHADIRARLARAHAALWPTGTLQERAANPLAFAARHGLDVFTRVADALPDPPDRAEHWVVRL